PGAGLVGPFGALIIGILTSLVCVWGVNGLKHMLKADDTLDVFGIHGVGGIIGALLTGIFNAQAFGGPGLASVGEIGGQLWVQLEGVLITVAWSAVVALVAYWVSGKICGGIRVSEEVERAGLDISEHGESAYHS
ncbi:MAG: ammonia channel protein, partial [Corticimicrobacter sp.]